MLGGGQKILLCMSLIPHLLLVPIYNNKCKKEIQKIREEKNIYSPNTIKTKFYLPNLDLDAGEFIQNTIFYNENYFEIETLERIKKYIKKGMRVIDIGANIGNHTLYFLNECECSFVTCFEPTVETFRILSKNIELNGVVDKTKLINAACGEKETFGLVIINDSDTGSNHIEIKEDGNTRIVAIDKLSDLGKVDFIKIDVEGFEYHVLKGMKEVIHKYKPIIFIEIWDKNRDKVIKLLNECGYSNGTKISEMDYLFEIK